MNVYLIQKNPRGQYQKDGVRYDLRMAPAGAVVRCPEDKQAEAETEVEAAVQLGLAAVEPDAATLAATKRRKIAQLEGRYRAELANGITIDKITLAATEVDQLQFTKLVVMLDGAERQLPDDQAKATFRDSQQTIVDFAGQTHVMTVSELRTLIVTYGQAIVAKWQQMAIQRAAVINAKDFSALKDN